MVIVFGNQKGGIGKSTFAVLFANYLTLVKNQRVIILDMDYQRSVLARYEEAKVLENPELYEVVEVDLENFTAIHHILKEEPGQYILIDLPGKIDDENLIPVIQSTDVFIIPFAYDKSSYQSTALFNLVTEELNSEALKFFIPNMIKGTAKYDTAKAIDNDFSKYGTVTPSMHHHVDFQRLNTRDLPVKLMPMIERVFGKVLKSIKK